jgi:hypothetical protein
MSDFVGRSSDKYYKAKEQLLFKQTKEGPSKRRKAASYRQLPAGSNPTSDRYYRSLEPQELEASPAAIKAAPVKQVELPVEVGTSILPKLISTFADGADSIVLLTPARALNQVRNSIDLAVGQKTLTRQQADAVEYRLLAGAQVEPVEELKKKRGRKPKNAGSESSEVTVLNPELETKLELDEGTTPAPVTEEVPAADTASDLDSLIKAEDAVVRFTSNVDSDE